MEKLIELDDWMGYPPFPNPHVTGNTHVISGYCRCFAGHHSDRKPSKDRWAKRRNSDHLLYLDGAAIHGITWV